MIRILRDWNQFFSFLWDAGLTRLAPNMSTTASCLRTIRKLRYSVLMKRRRGGVSTVRGVAQ